MKRTVIIQNINWQFLKDEHSNFEIINQVKDLEGVEIYPPIDITDVIEIGFFVTSHVINYFGYDIEDQYSIKLLIDFHIVCTPFVVTVQSIENG